MCERERGPFLSKEQFGKIMGASEEVMGEEPKCEKHPRYKGVHMPRVNCSRCWEVYNHKLEKSLKEQ